MAVHRAPSHLLWHRSSVMHAFMIRAFSGRAGLVGSVKLWGSLLEFGKRLIEWRTAFCLQYKLFYYLNLHWFGKYFVSTLFPFMWCRLRSPYEWILRTCSTRHILPCKLVRNVIFCVVLFWLKNMRVYYNIYKMSTEYQVKNIMSSTVGVTTDLYFNCLLNLWRSLSQFCKFYLNKWTNFHGKPFILY